MSWGQMKGKRALGTPLTAPCTLTQGLPWHQQPRTPQMPPVKSEVLGKSWPCEGDSLALGYRGTVCSGPPVTEPGATLSTLIGWGLMGSPRFASPAMWGPGTPASILEILVKVFGLSSNIWFV